MIRAYSRISTQKQNLGNQIDEINRYAKKNNLNIDQWYQEIASGKKSFSIRKLGKIISRMKTDDILIVSELSRLSRDIFDAINILGICFKKGINLYSIKENYALTGSSNNIIIGVISSLFSWLEREKISQRTKQSLNKLKSEGVKLGRPKGSSKIWNKLLSQKSEIAKLLKEKMAKSKIAKLYGISRVTLYKFIAKL